MTEVYSIDLIKKGQDYFYNSEVLQSKSGEVPKTVGWFSESPSSFTCKKQAEDLMADRSIGYSASGNDTAETRGGYKETFTSANATDAICATFGYDEYGMKLVGKTVVDVGAGDSRFAEDMNKLWGDLNTRVVAVDPKYSPDEQTHEKMSLFAQDLSQLNARHDNKPFADEVISNYGVTLVPPQDFSHSVLEMLKVCKETGTVKIVPCHIFRRIEEFTDEKGRERQKIGHLEVPYGVSFSKRLTVDMWRFDCEKSKVDEHELGVFLEQLRYPQGANCLQFWDSKDLMERRKAGEYVIEAFNATPLLDSTDFDFDEFLLQSGITPGTSSNLNIDKYGGIVHAS